MANAISPSKSRTEWYGLNENRYERRAGPQSHPRPRFSGPPISWVKRRKMKIFLCHNLIRNKIFMKFQTGISSAMVDKCISHIWMAWVLNSEIIFALISRICARGFVVVVVVFRQSQIAAKKSKKRKKIWREEWKKFQLIKWNAADP